MLCFHTEPNRMSLSQPSSCLTILYISLLRMNVYNYTVQRPEVQFNSIQFNKALQPYLCRCNEVLVIYMRIWLMVRHQQLMLPGTGNVNWYESSDIRLVVHLITNYK